MPAFSVSAPAGAHRFGAFGGHCQATLDYLGGDAIAGVAGAGAAGEDGGDDLAVGVDYGAARVAGSDVDAEAGDGALHRAPVVGVGGDHAPRRAGTRGLDVERAVLREAEDGGRLAWSRRRERHRSEPETVDAQDRHVVRVVEEDDMGPVVRPRAPRLYPGKGLPATTW